MLRLLKICKPSLASFAAHGIDSSQDLANETLDDNEDDDDDDDEHDGGYVVLSLHDFGPSVRICPKNLEFHHISQLLEIRTVHYASAFTHVLCYQPNRE